MELRCIKPCQINGQFLIEGQEAEFEDLPEIIVEAEAKSKPNGAIPAYVQFLVKPERAPATRDAAPPGKSGRKARAS